VRDSQALHTIRTTVEYDRVATVLNQLLDAGASDENHLLASFVETTGANPMCARSRPCQSAAM
jgi:hypothetical protein